MTRSRMEEKPDNTEKRRTLDRKWKETHRSEEAPEDTAKRRASVRQSMQRNRDEEAPEDTAKRRASVKQSMQRNRAEEAPEDTAKRRASVKQSMQRNRTEEAPEDTAKRRASVKQSMQRNRAEEAPEDTAKRRASVKQSMQRNRTEEAPEDTTKRQVLDRNNKQTHRSEEAPEVTEKRRASVRQSMQRNRTEEAPEDTSKRQVLDRNNKQTHRSEEAPEVTEKRRASVRQSMQRNRAEERIKVPTVSESSAMFQSKITEGPIYACCSCHRLLYRTSVIQMNIDKYASTNAPMKEILKHSKDLQTHSKSWVCSTCHAALKRGQTPTQSWANGLALDDIPPELQNLRPLELRLISQRIPFMKLIGLPKGGQKAIHGSAVNVPSKLHSITSLLPRLPQNAEVVPFKLKRKLIYTGHYMYEYIRPKKVMEALHWLQQHNPLYKDITICQDWEYQWENDDADLWEAMTQACADEMDTENVQIPLSQVTTSRRPDTRNIPSPIPNALPAGNDYQVLQCLARRHSLSIRDVPGDGDCFFHAVASGLPAAGIQAISGPDIRTRLIHFLETTELSHEYATFIPQPTAQINRREQAVLGSPGQQHLKELMKSYITGLRHGEWADNIAVQGVAEMLNINIKVLNTITTDWMHDIHPKNQQSDNTVTIGLMGELHYVALERDTSHNNQADGSAKPKDTFHSNKADDMPNQRQDIEDEEDQIAFEQTSKLRGIPYDTLLQEEQPADADNTYSVAPGENQRPCPFLLDDNFEELANPSKYPYGCGGLSVHRTKKVTHRKYFNQRLLDVDGRFAKDIDYLLAAQYTVESKQIKDDLQISLRQTHGKTFKNRQVNAGLLKFSANLDAMIRTDTAFRFLKNVRGSPAYWKTVLLDLLAMVRQLGIPTWFLTLSAADMQWPEVIQSIARQYGTILTDDDVKSMPWEEKCQWLRCNPVTAARQFQHRLDMFFKDFIGAKSNPIGELQDYMIRVEFQARGSPHAHTILWIKDAPKLDVNRDEEVTSFIDKYQRCSIPQGECDLKRLVLSVQKHVHSKTCRRSGKCRFRFPHPPSSETVIARPSTELDPIVAARQFEEKQAVLCRVRQIMDNTELAENLSLPDLLQIAKVDSQQYQQALKLTKTGKQIILHRHPSERWINQYNPDILRTWRANMDLQFITDPYSCIMYITSYMLKSERAMSELLRKVGDECRGEDIKSKLKKVGSAFLNNREVSAQEAAYRLLSLPLKRASRKVVFVNTAPKEKRVSMLKPMSVLKDMDDDAENIFCTSLMDRYASRPHELENMCMAEFAATYTTGGKVVLDDVNDHVPDVLDDDVDLPASSTITLLNGLGRMRKRKKHCVIRFHKEKEGEAKYRNLLMLYYPWRDEERDLKGNFPSFEEKYSNVRDAINENEVMFTQNADEVEHAFEDLERMGPPGKPIILHNKFYYYFYTSVTA